ncbi:MAG: thiamine pyrophosphate-binding protein [Bacteroidia bacterium]|nr:thiamine pyrophosphate-binding protein [Bacteroidia bacterium]
MTVADHIANQLFNAGVRHVFGIPGGPSIPYMEAFKSAGIKFMLVSNEASAGIMADVTARLTGIPGVCHATFGPGATNISTGIGGALLDRSPVIVLTSEMSDSLIGRTTQMNINHQKLFEPLTKATFRLNRDNADDMTGNALKICMEEYPGPVHIGLPSDIADQEINTVQYKTSAPEIQDRKTDIQKITALLGESRRPVLAVGLTSKRMKIGKELLSFLEKYKMPVVITPMAKGIIPENHPCYAGVLFHALSDYLSDLYEKCDLVIGLGYDQVEFNYESWIPDVPLIHFDTRESDLPEREDILQFTGLPDEWFSVLDNLNAGSLVFEKAMINGLRDEMISVFNGFSSHFGPVAAMKVLMEELPDNSIITADVGSHLHLLGQFWETGSGGEIIMTNGWSGMGFGIPAAMAAQISRPGSTVVCITGDGGFLMMAGEMVTAKRYNLPVIVVVFSDGELNLIKLKQSWKELAPYGTILYQGDLFGSDTFLGVKVITAGSNEKMAKAVNNALAMNEPVIINAIIDPEDYKYLIVKQ